MSFLEKIISKILFCPDKEVVYTPDHFSLNPEHSWVNSNGKKLSLWYFRSKIQTKKHVIYFHGSKGNKSHYLKGINCLCKTNANVVIFDYQGFGHSEGKALIRNSIIDAVNIHDYVASTYKLNPENINLFGYSYGGAVAIEVANQRKVNAILIESTFSSLNEIACEKYPFLSNFLVSKKLLNSKSRLKSLNIPLIVAYAEKDNVVPVKNSLKLYSEANDPKHLFEIKGAEHHNICDFVTDEYINLIKKVFNLAEQ